MQGHIYQVGSAAYHDGSNHPSRGHALDQHSGGDEAYAFARARGGCAVGGCASCVCVCVCCVLSVCGVLRDEQETLQGHGKRQARDAQETHKRRGEEQTK